MEGKLEFVYQFEDSAPKIVMTISPQSTLDEAFEAFGQFLRGAGYHIEGDIGIIDNEIIEKYEDSKL